MKISKLVYLCVKNVDYFDDSAFTYDNFCKGRYNENPDYALYINNVFSPLNQAIARLSDLERIPYIISQLTVNDNVAPIPNDCKEIVGVAQQINGQFKKLPTRRFTDNNILITHYVYEEKPVYIEYKQDIPYFDDSYLPPIDVNENVDHTNEVDLIDYGITESMCNYIIEFVGGRLAEPKSPELANAHRSLAENCFSGIKSVTSAFQQEKIDRAFSIEE